MSTRRNILLFAFLFICQIGFNQNFWKRQIRGEGPIVEKEITLSGFTGISNGFAANVYVKKGDHHEITMKGQRNILDNLILSVKDHVLKIRYDRVIKRAEPVEIYVTIPSLHLVKTSGSGNIKTLSKFDNVRQLELGVSGSGRIDLDVDAQEIYGKISGSGDLLIEGTADAMDFRISGSGRVQGRNLAIGHCDASISGSGNADLNINKSLTASISGSGNIRYEGENIKLNSKITGSGSVRSL